MNRITFAPVPGTGVCLKDVVVGSHVFGITTHDGCGMISPYDKRLSYEDWEYHLAVMSHILKEVP